MKKPTQATIARSLFPGIVCASVCLSSAYAATVFNDASPTDSLISNPDNWGNGLPTGGNGGTLAINAGYDTDVSLDGYDITHTDGTLSRAAGLGSLPIGAGTTFRMNGANAQLAGSTRGINVNGVGASFILDQGTADATNNSKDSAINGTGTMTINGGTMSIGRHLYLQNGDITVNGGSLTVAADLGARNFHTGGNLTLNGGTIRATNLTYGTGGLNLTFGGSTAGTFTIDNFGGSRHNASAIGIDFLAGSLMTMQLTAPVESGVVGDGDVGWMEVGSETGQAWAEALWATGRLTYNGDDFNTLGDWATVDGSIFNYDGGSHALSLVPEPSAFALFSILFGLSCGRRRRPRGRSSVRD